MRTVEAIAQELADGFVADLTSRFRGPARMVCPTDEAEQAVVDAVTQGARGRGIPVEIIDLRAAPVERLDAVTARLDGWHGAPEHDASAAPTLLILRGFDVFGDEASDKPTYTFRSNFQFDRKFLWLFIGRDAGRMRFLFDSYHRPLYQAAGNITPKDWRAARESP